MCHVYTICVVLLLLQVGVWFLPGMILQTAAFMMSVAWAVLASSVSYLVWGRDDVAQSSAVMVGIVAFLFAFITLAFINSGKGLQHNGCLEGCHILSPVAGCGTLPVMSRC